MTQPLLEDITPNKTHKQPQNVGKLAHFPPSYVLLVDDDPAVRSFLKRSLEGGGYITKQAGSAAEALDMIVAETPSLVLCDIRMPGEDGLWLAERLHARWPLIPVIMATAIDDLETVRQSRRVGAVDYITKPIAPDQLLQVLRRAISAPKEAILPAENSEDAADAAWPAGERQASNEAKSDAEYRLEFPVRCPACGERIETLKAIRLIRSQVNFTSTLPRRGRVLACPHCLAVVSAELSNF
jgi:CheY-like chemotaxis protein